MVPEQVRTLVVRFPNVLGYDVKGHLRPHLAYLASLGVEQEQLQDLVLCRPQVLGPGIERLVGSSVPPAPSLPARPPSRSLAAGSAPGTGASAAAAAPDRPLLARRCRRRRSTG